MGPPKGEGALSLPDWNGESEVVGKGVVRGVLKGDEKELDVGAAVFGVRGDPVCVRARWRLGRGRKGL